MEKAFPKPLLLKSSKIPLKTNMLLANTLCCYRWGAPKKNGKISIIFKVNFYLIPRLGILLKYERGKKEQRKAAAYNKVHTDPEGVRLALTLLQMT